jgi:hypothetical protein
LTNTADPKRDLVELKLPPELDRFVGTTGFSPNAPIAEAGFQKDFFDRIGYGKLARFYAARPGRVWRALERRASHAFEMRPSNVGNLARETGRPARSRTGSCAIWSRAKELLVPARLWFVIAYLIVNLIAALELRLRARKRSVRLAGEIWIVVALVAAFQFSVAALMDHESRRSLFLFNAASDLLFAALCLRAGIVFAYERAEWGREIRTTGPSADGVSLPPSRL